VEPLLFLSHRIPYPPNKGDKVRSYHLVRHLAKRYRLFVGTFIDDRADWGALDAFRPLCAEVFARPRHPLRNRMTSLSGLITGEALTLTYYRDSAMLDWVRNVLAREDIRKCFVFCSAMAQYVAGRPDLKRIVDLVDVDSEKWRQYASDRPWPLSWIYRREADRLLAAEAAIAQEFDATLLVTSAERELFTLRTPQSAACVHVVANGVDTDNFSPAVQAERPFPAQEKAIVFTGAMDYWPNADAARWFASAILPKVLEQEPRAHFYVVGMNPPATVQSLAQHPAVTVTGRVADTRPYLKHASVVVAPLRVARGVQNKILEAMALARPVVASVECARSLSAAPGSELLTAADEAGFASNVLAVLSGALPAMGDAARARVLADYQWEENLARIDALLDDARHTTAQPADKSAPAIPMRAAQT